MALLEASGIGKNFGDTKVLKDISLTLEQGEALAIIGSSGSGKTTLLRCLNFLERPDTGIIKVNGETMWDAADPATQRESEIRKKRLHFGLVFQNFNLFPQYTALQNVMLAGELLAKERPDYKANKKAIHAELEQQAQELLAQMGLSARAGHYPHQLSGGQQQRVAIARALATNPTLLLADEPTGALDQQTGRQVMQLFREINAQGHTIVMITHEMNVVKQICNRVAVMNLGEVVEEGDVIDIFAQPKTETTRALIGQVMDRDLPQSIIDTVNRARAKEGHDNVHLLHLSFIGSEVAEPVISTASREFNINFSILRGTVDDLQGRTLGTLTLLVTAPVAVYQEAVKYIRERGVLVEEIPNV